VYVELLHRADQAQVASWMTSSRCGSPPCPRNAWRSTPRPEVGLDQLPLRDLARLLTASRSWRTCQARRRRAVISLCPAKTPRLDEPGQVDLAGGGQQLDLADLAEVVPATGRRWGAPAPTRLSASRGRAGASSAKGMSAGGSTISTPASARASITAPTARATRPPSRSPRRRGRPADTLPLARASRAPRPVPANPRRENAELTGWIASLAPSRSSGWPCSTPAHRRSRSSGPTGRDRTVRQGRHRGPSAGRRPPRSLTTIAWSAPLAKE